mmetsp:Transcript_18955/g.28609  ORF Transcript_18955/g.28609 Transcript_18955/m.28609 type:complete len:110 (-) Transcript_18955:1163-1492(-)
MFTKCSCSFCFFVLGCVQSKENKSSLVAYRLGFGSCLSQYRTSKALEVASSQDLDSFIFLGDNGYHDMPSCGIPWNAEPCTKKIGLKCSIVLSFIFIDELDIMNKLRIQ